jgi:DNA-binding beta-propeller fold protein YncE
MKFLRNIALVASGIALLTATSTNASTPASGSDGSLEWRTLTSMDLPAKALHFKRSLDGKYLFVLTEDHRVLVYDQRNTLQGSIPVDPGVTDLDIAPQGQLLYLIDTEKQVTTTLAIDFVVDIDTSNSAYKGNIDAPVTVVVFSDFQ